MVCLEHGEFEGSIQCPKCVEAANKGTYWNNGSWRGSKQPKQEPEKHPEVKPTYYNPLCKHDRCSYSIATCQECQHYSMRRGWADGQNNSQP